MFKKEGARYLPRIDSPAFFCFWRFQFLPICVIFSCISGCPVLVLGIFSDYVAHSYHSFSQICLVWLFRVAGYTCVSESRSIFLLPPQFRPALYSDWYFTRIRFIAKCCPISAGRALLCFRSYSTSAELPSCGLIVFPREGRFRCVMPRFSFVLGFLSIRE